MHIEGPESIRVYLGLYEIELNPWIRRLTGPNTPTFDIGAQFGFDSLMFAKLGSPCVLTVEGDPALRTVIQHNLDRNRVADRVSLETAWIGDGNDGTVTIDHLAATYFAPAFVKMDIEGAEAIAFQGAAATLRSCDRWLIETHGLAEENFCIRTLAEHGFRIETISPRRWLRDRRTMEHNRWLIAYRGHLG